MKFSLRTQGSKLQLVLSLVAVSAMASTSWAKTWPAHPANSPLEHQILSELQTARETFIRENFSVLNIAQGLWAGPSWKFLSKVDHLIEVATAGMMNQQKICNYLSRASYYPDPDKGIYSNPELAEAYQQEYKDTICMPGSGFYGPSKSGWQLDNKVAVSMTVGGFRNTQPRENFNRLADGTTRLLTWLVRNDKSPLQFVTYNGITGPDEYDREEKAAAAQRAYEANRTATVNELTGKNWRLADDNEQKAAFALQSRGTDLSEKVRVVGNEVYVAPMISSDWLMKQAFNAVSEEKISGKISGIDAHEAFEFFKTWLPAEGLSAISYTENGVSLYSISALTVLIQQYRPELNEILNEGWVPMPLETSSVWALQEMKISTHRDISAFAIATPVQIYISPNDYVEFMRIYRANKQALVGETIAASIQQLNASVKDLQAGVSEDLKGIQSSIESNSAATQEIGASLKSIKHAAWLSAIVSLLR